MFSFRSFEDDKIVIYIESLSFGLITLEDVETSMTIANMKKMVRSKIDHAFTGYDIEVALDAERAASLVFEGHDLEAGCRLSDYNIQNESTIRATFGLLGGGTYVSFCFISFHFLFSFGNAIKCNKCLVIAAASLCFFLLFCICLIHTT